MSRDSRLKLHIGEIDASRLVFCAAIRGFRPQSRFFGRECTSSAAPPARLSIQCRRRRQQAMWILPQATGTPTATRRRRNAQERNAATQPSQPPQPPQPSQPSQPSQPPQRLGRAATHQSHPDAHSISGTEKLRSSQNPGESRLSYRRTLTRSRATTCDEIHRKSAQRGF